MKGNELVWRTLLDGALRHERRWENLGDLAYRAGVPHSTTHLAVRRLTDIGAVAQHPRGGFSAISPEKILTMLCASRNLRPDTLAKTTLEAAEPLLDSQLGPYALGGPDAAITYLDHGVNTVAHFSQHIVYIAHRTGLHNLPIGDEVTILAMDARAEKEWDDGYTSLAQTYADLFATPGWQASEFRRALWDKYFGVRDWEERPLDA